MLLRSSSTPILNSWIPHSPKESTPEPAILPQIAKSRSIKLSATSSSSSSYEGSIKKMDRALSETDVRELSIPKRRHSGSYSNWASLDEEKEMEITTDSYWNIKDCDVQSEGEIGGGGGKICGGGGPGGGGGGGDSQSEDDLIDGYYLRMIEINPSNGLLIGNYARFLKEVRRDLVRAEEYCGRAILVNPSDGDVLAMYGELVWHTHKDAARADSYFDRAIKASPDDSYVMASYARFLWDSEEEDDEVCQQVVNDTATATASLPRYFHEASPPLATAT